MGTAHRSYLTVVRLLLLICVISPGYGWGQAADPIGTVLAAEGTAEVRPQGTARWEIVRFRDPLLLNDTVRTGLGSKVKVILRDDSVITLAEQSEMQFSEFLLTPQQRRLIVTLAVGTLQVIAERHLGSGSVTEVRTPNAIVGVEGTTFMVKYIPPDTTDVISLAGIVGVRNRALMTLEIQPILQNFRTRVVGTTPPTKAVEVSAATLQQLVQEVRVIEQIPQAVLTSEELQLLDAPRESTRASAVDTRLAEPSPVVVAPPVQLALAPAVAREQPATAPGDTLQTRVITPETSIAISRARIRLIFPGR